MKKTIIPAILAIAALALFTGCEKETEQYAHEPGTDIIFGASTTWNNDIETRTEYSGKDQNDNNISSSSTFERIDWVAEKDRIRILCDAASGKATPGKKMADYVIYNVRKGSDKKKSEADITSCDNNSLQWGTGTHVFYALYPAAGTESNYNFTSYKTATEDGSKIESVSGTKAKISGSIPATQEAVKDGNIYKPNMNYAYMFATTKVSANSSGNVLLSFDPLVTSLEFSLTNDSTDPVTGNLTRVELSSTSTALTGSFSATIDGNGSTPSVSVTASSYSASNNKITITLPSGGVELSDTPVKVTFLTLPVEQKDLTITLYFGSDFSKKRTLKLNTADGPVSVKARKKAYFSFGVPNLAYTLDVHGPSGIVSSTGGSKTYEVQSYKKAGSNAAVGVGWTAEFMEVGKSTTWSSTKPAWLDVFTSADNAGSVSFKAYTATLLENDDLTNAVPKEWRGSKTSVGSSDRPINLALRDIYGTYRGANGAEVIGPADAVLNTANCYVVSEPGWYCFPIIYGNAYKNDVDNPSSYKSSATAVSPYGALGTFVNHLGNGISDGWIQNNTDLTCILSDPSRIKVKLLWEDRKDLIDESSLDTFLEQPRPTDPESHSNMGRYIKFHIDPSKIFQGNAVIAFYVDNVIAWSWHIWVIERDRLGTKALYPGSASVVNPVQMMEWNLGWYDTDLVTYPRSVKVKVTQKESGKTKEFEIVQDQPMLHGGNVFYNWGRKDPMLGMKADFTQKEQYGPSQWTKQVLGESEAKSIADGIKNPNVFFVTNSGLHVHNGSWSTPRYENLWNTNAGTKYNTDVAVTKTIYDPCPPGFKIPNRNVFMGFKLSTLVGDWSQGWFFKTGSTGSETLFFPATFLRDYDSGEIDDWRRYGYTFPEPTGYLEGYIGGYYWTATTYHIEDPKYWGAVYLEIRDHSNLDPTPYIVPDTGKGPVGYGFSVRAVKE